MARVWAAGAACRLPAGARRGPSHGILSGSRLRGCLTPQQRPQPGRRGRELRALVLARDGKKRRKPASRDGGASSSSDEEGPPRPAPPPRRVDSTINISVRQQISWARQNKEYERQQTAGYRKPPVPQAFRQESLDSEEYRR